LPGILQPAVEASAIGSAAKILLYETPSIAVEKLDSTHPYRLATDFFPATSDYRTRLLSACTTSRACLFIG
jgi:hypothetical protein